ncbi:MAG TPA: hypothetical protein VHZ09_01355 [Acidobacteriaceae bacterium]|jgi:hypothetical protein|nr:hypothetical protein [Acidobacteriaceae bacterium]
MPKTGRALFTCLRQRFSLNVFFAMLGVEDCFSRGSNTLAAASVLFAQDQMLRGGDEWSLVEAFHALDWVGRFATETPRFATGGASLRAGEVQRPLHRTVAALRSA